jgi:acyl-CoA thioester hydrolase
MNMDAGIGVEVWRGSVNTWECDGMGHMNVRFYAVRALEGLVGLAAAMGMPRAFSPTAGATLLIREQHIRFLREALAGTVLTMRGWVAEMGESEARLVQVLFHPSGEPAASFQTVVSHVTPVEGRPFAWTESIRRGAEALMAPVPAFAAARSIDLSPVESRASLGAADALDLLHLTSGAVLARDCDVFGRMSAEQFIGRVSDGIPGLVERTRKTIVEAMEDKPKRVGGAVLEYRLVHLDWPRAGDRIAIRSGLVSVDQRTQRMIHWMLDPETGRPWGVSEAVAVTLDLDQRKIVPVSQAAQAALNAVAVKGLTL